MTNNVFDVDSFIKQYCDIVACSAVCHQVAPCCVVVSSKQDERVISVLKQIAVGESHDLHHMTCFCRILMSFHI